jgi:hypothetical protein
MGTITAGGGTLTGTLDLSMPLSFVGTIAGFSAGDMIDLINTPETTFSFGAGTLSGKV